MIIKQLEIGYMDNFCWEKRNNVNAIEYGFWVKE